MPEVTNHIFPLELSEREMISTLLRYREAVLDVKVDNRRKDGIGSLEKLENYLIDEYDFTTDGLGNLRKKTNGSTENGLQRNKEPEKWRLFIKREREMIGKEINSKRYDQFNYSSAKGLVKSAENALRCIFFNTYIPMNGWHSPIIQMHLCLQKSIEQGNTFSYIQPCHNSQNNHTERHPHIKSCTDNPPGISHYRILLLPMTDWELNRETNTSKSFAENLKFSALMHHTLSIQLALVTVTQFKKIILKNKTFFTNSKNLEMLDIDESIIELIEDDTKTSEIEILLKSTIERMKMPTEQLNYGLDYMYIEEKEGIENDGLRDDEVSNIWGAYYCKDYGLTYYTPDDEAAIKVKSEFAELMFKSLTVSAPFPANPFNFLSSFNKYFESDPHKRHIIFKDSYNALERINKY
jgi:hypothetical protein